MFVIKENKASLDSVQPTMNICANTTLKQALKDKKVKKLLVQVCFKSTIKVPSQHTENTTMVLFQIIFSFTEMVLVIP